LLLGKLDDLLFDKHALSLAHGVHVRLGDVCAVRLFSKVFELFDGRWDPKGILVERLEAGEDELRGCRTGCPLSDF
jgi:hypothetical protein